MGIEGLVTQHLDWLGRVSRWYCRDSADAEDLVGDTVYKILRCRDMYSPDKDFKPWARTIMHNIYVNWYNRRQRVPIGPIEEWHEVVSCARADDMAAFHILMSILRGCARRSVSVQSLLLHVKGYSYSEIAARLGISTGTVGSRINTGRKMVREALRQQTLKRRDDD